MNGAVEDLQWIGVEEPSSVGAARRYTDALTRRLGFDESRVAEVAIAVTEIASNAVKHGSASSILFRTRRNDMGSCIELVVIDTGPGVSDIDALFEDGTSSTGTLGIGLGAIRRIANRLDLFSLPGHGTVMVATFGNGAGDQFSDEAIDGLTRPITGEHVCGDAWAAHESGDHLSIVISDGLGHGELAAQASRAAIQCFDSAPTLGPAAQIDAIHRALRGTRGAAVMAAQFDRKRATLTVAGVGNIAGRIVSLTKSVSLSSQPGIVGHHLQRVRAFEYDVDPMSVVVLHSDGLTSKWNLSSYLGLEGQSPTVIGAVLLREAGARHDDASVVVLRAS